MKKIGLFILIIMIISTVSPVRAEGIEEIRQYFELRDTLNLVNLEMKRVLAPDSKSPMLADHSAENNLAQVLNFLEARVEQFAKGDSGLKYYYESRLRNQLIESARLYPKVVERIRNYSQTGSTVELKVEPRPLFNPIDFRTLISPSLQHRLESSEVTNANIKEPEKVPAKLPETATEPSKPTSEIILKATAEIPAEKSVIAPQKPAAESPQALLIPVEVVQPTKAVEPEPVITKPVVVAPATDDTEAGAAKAMRPLAVIIENHNKARPQSGFESAKVLYEIPVEGGITRFMALYYSLPDSLGPVRSCREYFVDRALEVDALLVHCGASPLGYQVISKSGIKSVDEIKNSRGFYRDKSRRAPHNLYTTGKKIYDYMASRVPMRVAKQVQPLNYSDNPTVSDSVGNSVSIRYHGNYNLAITFVNEAYERSMNKVKHVDRESKKTLKFGTVIVQTAVMKVVDKAGRQDISFIGSGTAVIMQKGTLTVGKWLKPDMAAMTRYYDSSGNEISFAKGLPVLIQVVSPSHKVVYNGKLEAAQLLKQQEKHGVGAVGNDRESSEVQSGSKDLPENLKG